MLYKAECGRHGTQVLQLFALREARVRGESVPVLNQGPVELDQEELVQDPVRPGESLAALSGSLSPDQFRRRRPAVGRSEPYRVEVDTFHQARDWGLSLPYSQTLLY